MYLTSDLNFPTAPRRSVFLPP